MTLTAAPRETPASAPLVDVVIPVYNEEADLERSVRRLHTYLTLAFPFPSRVTIADNASTDGTWPIALRLAHELRGVQAVHLPEKGRGGALAKGMGLRIHEVPVDWTDDPDSRVDLWSTAVEDLRGILRIAVRPPAAQLAAFAAVGAVSTAAYVLLYWLLRPLVPAAAANATA